VENILIFMAVLVGLYFFIQIFVGTRTKLLAMEMWETLALKRELKRVYFEVTPESFLSKLQSSIAYKIVLENGQKVPDELWDDFCSDIVAILPKMYPPKEELRFWHFTEAHQHIEFRAKLREFISVYKSGPESLERVIYAFTERLFNVMILLPNKSLLHREEDNLSFEADNTDLMEDASRIIEILLLTGTGDDHADIGAFEWFRKLCHKNICEASGLNPDQFGLVERKKLILPTESKLPIEKQIAVYLKGSPFKTLFEYKVKLAFPEDTRFEHHHIVAGSGHGKTQTLQYLIANDLEKVVREQASIVVIDSQGDLIRNILNLECVDSDNLVLIDPTDVEFPVCLNLFDVQMDRINSYSRLHREQMINGILELYDFVLGSLLGAEMTQKQSVIFRYVTRLMLYIPDATIHTMLELFQDGGTTKYQSYIEQLEGTARNFFEHEFDSREFTQTKRQVVRRLFGILENQTFNRMFSHPRSKLDLFKEMNSGKIILINTAKDLLKQAGTEIFGRFFIAMIAQAAQERATLDDKDRLPTYVYIDEAQEYFDENIGIILSQARKFKVGMVMAHQYLDQLSPKLQSAFMSNTSIKFAGGVSMKDARALAGEMRVDPDFIASQPKGRFAATMRGLTKKAISLKIPFGYMEELEQHQEWEHFYICAAMRKRYAVPIAEMEEIEPLGETDEGEENENLQEDSSPTPEPQNTPPQKTKTISGKPRLLALPSPNTDPDNPDITPSDDL